MKKFTRKQRAEIYLEAAEFIDLAVKNYCCDALRYVTNSWDTNEELLTIFPEFELFAPKKLDLHKGWWGMYVDSNYQRNPRILALLFARQIALNP